MAVVDLDDDQRAALGRLGDRDRLDNIFATFIRHPRMFRPYAEFGWYLLEDSTLDPRHRELAILRVAARTSSAYEAAQHRRIALRAGLTTDEVDLVAEIAAPLDARDGFDELDRSIVVAADELLAGHVVGDDTWSTLASFLDERQLIDLVFTIGAYCMIAFALNSFGVAIDDRLSDRDLARPAEGIPA